ncbi:hypothetical protein [Okeania sp.]|uniref:hypothetical protein n=1 Tax=Okeania sp. TaxID=3100323 RepID=UPI002B4B16A5|nr:hypothetical protein [Okeania sp.]MEB3343630.1 hypothetical protein [Okeania sp.]
MSHLIKPLNLTAHPKLEKSLGYQANYRWVAFHWEPETNQVIYNDNHNFGAGINPAWEIFIHHPLVSVELKDYQLDETDKYWLILDRKNRNLYVAEATIVPTMFEQPESLNLLAALDEKNHGISIFNTQTERLRLDLFAHSIKPLIPIGIFGALFATLSFGSWSLIRSRFSQQANQNPIPQVVVGSAACGVGGSNDFSSFFNTPKRNKELHLIGVYEASSDHKGRYHPTGIINVSIERQNQPIILALSSYEPVDWNLSLGKDVKIEKIIINGYHDQKISGVSGIPIEEFSYEGTGKYLGEFVYKWNKLSPNSETVSLVTKLEKLTDTNLTSFQGCYRGNRFSIE